MLIKLRKVHEFKHVVKHVAMYFGVTEYIDEISVHLYMHIYKSKGASQPLPVIFISSLKRLTYDQNNQKH